LPSKVVVYYVLAMALYASAGYRELFRLSLEGLRAPDPSVPLVVPQRSAFLRRGSSRRTIARKPSDAAAVPGRQRAATRC
jgi:hypothetical protein